MKKLTIIVSIIVILFLLAFFIVPKERFSELENRALESVPKLNINDVLSGKYMTKVENYISDHFPLKNTFLYVKTSFLEILGFKEINDVYIGNGDYLIENYGKLDDKDDIIRTFNNLNNNTKVNLKLMIVPTKIMINQEKLPKHSKYTNQEEEINYIYKNINFSNINILDELKKEKNNYELFYKTDHHWTSFGAYFGYKLYREANNLVYFDLNKLKTKEVTDSFLGTTYSKVTNYNQKPDSIYIFKFINDLKVEYVDEQKESNSLYNFDYLNKKDKYSIFLDNNHGLIKITNEDIKEGHLLIIKDSFANSMIPLLTNHYREIDVIDPRYYKRSISKYINDNNIKDALIIYNYGTLSTDKNVLSIR